MITALDHVIKQVEKEKGARRTTAGDDVLVSTVSMPSDKKWKVQNLPLLLIRAIQLLVSSFMVVVETTTKEHGRDGTEGKYVPASLLKKVP